MKKIIGLITTVILFAFVMQPVFAQGTSYTVVKGDSLWKISQKYQIKLDAVIKANPQIPNPDLIYPAQLINIPIETQQPNPTPTPNPTPEPIPTPAPNPEGTTLNSLEIEVIRLVNIERTNRGLAALETSNELSHVARVKAQDMIDNNYFSHTSPTYGSPFTMMEKFGLKFSAAAENIAYGQRSAQEVVTAWMNSPGHRANILSPSYTQTGVGAAKKSDGTIYWSQMFMKPY